MRFYSRIVAGLALVTWIVLPTAAWACGGFFCNSATPVDQSSEDILFTVDEEAETVRAIVRIRYEGPPSDFSWILPMPSVPEVSVGTDVVFEAIRSVSDVQFNTTSVRHNCHEDVFSSSTESSEAGGEATEGFDAGSGGGVAVFEQGQTGPYDYVVLTASSATELVEWLEDNLYDVPDGSTQLMDHYIAQDMVFIAVKLQATAGVGDIAPIVLELSEPDPCVPLVLTSVAAQPDMPIRVWIAAKGQAIPRNWFHVEPNWTRLNWRSPGVDGNNGQLAYNDLVARAVDEAAGHGFVTEFLGEAEPSKQAISSALNMEEQVMAATTVGQVVSRLDNLPGALAVSNGFSNGQLSGWLVAALEEAFGLPEDTGESGEVEAPSATEFYSFNSHRFDELEFDGDKMRAVMAERIFDPLRDADGWLADHSTMTRIFTLVSPEEMTRDPIFAIRENYEPISNIHTATLIGDCKGEPFVQTTIVRLPDGSQFELPFGGQSLPWQDREPFSRAVAVESPDEGTFLVAPDDVEFVDNQFDMVTGALAVEGLTPAAPYTPRRHSKLSSDGCSASTGPRSTAFALGAWALGFAVFAFRRACRFAS